MAPWPSIYIIRQLCTDGHRERREGGVQAEREAVEHHRYLGLTNLDHDFRIRDQRFAVQPSVEDGMGGLSDGQERLFARHDHGQLRNIPSARRRIVWVGDDVTMHFFGGLV